MEDFTKSKSFHSERNNTQIQVYGSDGTAAPPFNFRSYSTSYASSSVYADSGYSYGNPKLKKGKSMSNWGFNDPELQRKKRVASYKVYSVEGKVKGSFRKSVRWIKDKYTQVVYGWW